MVYDPYAPTQRNRSYTYWVQFIGLAATVISIALVLFRPDSNLPGITLGAAIGGMLASGLPSRTDDYYRELCAMGHRFMAIGLAGMTFAVFVWRDLVNDGAGGSLIDDPMLLGLCTALCFYTGYAFAFLRDRAWSQGEP